MQKSILLKNQKKPQVPSSGRGRSVTGESYGLTVPSDVIVAWNYSNVLLKTTMAEVGGQTYVNRW